MSVKGPVEDKIIKRYEDGSATYASGRVRDAETGKVSGKARKNPFDFGAGPRTYLKYVKRKKAQKLGPYKPRDARDPGRP